VLLGVWLGGPCCSATCWALITRLPCGCPSPWQRRCWAGCSAGVFQLPLAVWGIFSLKSGLTAGGFTWGPIFSASTASIASGKVGISAAWPGARPPAADHGRLVGGIRLTGVAFTSQSLRASWPSRGPGLRDRLLCRLPIGGSSRTPGKIPNAQVVRIIRTNGDLPPLITAGFSLDGATAPTVGLFFFLGPRKWMSALIPDQVHGEDRERLNRQCSGDQTGPDLRGGTRRRSPVTEPPGRASSSRWLDSEAPVP